MQIEKERRVGEKKQKKTYLQAITHKKKTSFAQNLKTATCPFNGFEQNPGDNTDIAGNQLCKHLCAGEQFTAVLKGRTIKSGILQTECASSKHPLYTYLHGHWEMMQIKTVFQSFPAHY